MVEQENDAILFDIDQGGIAVLQVNRPQVRNALNWAAQERFAACVAAVKEDSGARALIITGTGDHAFVAGGDLRELSQDISPEAGLHLNRVMSQALADLRTLPFPVISAINGDTFGGGCEIITACDLRISGDQARFSFAQVRNGLTTGWGGSERLVQLVGLSRACDLLLTGRIFNAQEAHEFGLVHRLVPNDANVQKAARLWTEELAKLPAPSLAAMKQLLYAAATLPSEAISSLETSLFLDQWAAPDHREALTAFLEKRKPNFNQEVDN